jgi:hypothetical protein
VWNLLPKAPRRRLPQPTRPLSQTSCPATTWQAQQQLRTPALGRRFSLLARRPGKLVPSSLFANDASCVVHSALRGGFLLIDPPHSSPLGLVLATLAPFCLDHQRAPTDARKQFHVPRSGLRALPFASTLGQCCPASSVARTFAPKLCRSAVTRDGGPRLCHWLRQREFVYDNCSCPLEGPQG